MLRATSALYYPLKAIRWLAEDTYKKNPEARLEAERAMKLFYKDNEKNLEDRGATELVVQGPLHNDPRKPDPKGLHWTVGLLNAAGKFITKRHVYPEDQV